MLAPQQQQRMESVNGGRNQNNWNPGSQRGKQPKKEGYQGRGGGGQRNSDQKPAHWTTTGPRNTKFERTLKGNNWTKPTPQQKTNWKQPDLKPAPAPAKNAWETGALASKINAPPTRRASQAPPTPMMNRGPKSLTNAWKMATSAKKTQAPPKNSTPGPSGPRAPGMPRNYAPGPSRSRTGAPPPSKPAPEYEYLEGDLKKHKYAADLNEIFKNLMETGKVERTVAKPVKKEKEEDMIQRHSKWRWEVPFPKNPIRGDLVIIDDEWHAKNSLQRISNPKRKPDDANKNPYDSIDLKKYYLVPKHLEYEHRNVKDTATRIYIFESQLEAEAASVAKPESPDVAKRSNSKRSSFSSGIGTSVEDLEERSGSEQEDDSDVPYHLRTPTRARSPSDPFNSDWDENRYFIDPTIPQKYRYLQCTSSTCLCHKRHPSFKKQQ